jgi:exopolyphosphatase/guanosine-5'-triphosphate,3'-diphosphate pyrophosphatase
VSIRASIDIGSNSVLLLVMNTDTKGILAEESRITSLGRDLDKNGAFHPESMNDTFSALREYREICLENNVSADDIVVTATEAARVAGNSKEFFSKVENELELSINIISGEGEAYYTAFGISEMSQQKSDFVIMDIGGASTELIEVKASPFEIIKSVSLPLGSVRTTDWVREGIETMNFSKVLDDTDLSSYQGKNLICVAGTMTSLAMIFAGVKNYDMEAINTLHLSQVDLEEKLKSFLAMEDSIIESRYEFLGKRKKTIKGGARCACEILQTLKMNEIYFSTYGLRYGTLISGEINENFRL